MPICPYSFPDDQEYQIEFRRNGVLHRDPTEGPAYIEASEHYIIETYCWNGRFHREGGPAEIWWDRHTGELLVSNYWRHSKAHREPDEGPAALKCENGVLVYEAYYFNDKIYRDPSEGPSRIWRYAQGDICRVRHSVRKDLTKARQMLERAAKRAGILPRVPPHRPLSPVRQPEQRGP
jgi:hypothetical protein